MKLKLKRRPLRQNLALWSALVVAGTLVPLALFSISYVRAGQLQVTDERLQDTCENFATMYVLHREEDDWLHEHKFVKIFHPDGRPERFLRILDRAGASLYTTENFVHVPEVSPGVAFQTLPVEGRPVRLCTFTHAEYTITFGINISSIDEVTKDLAIAYLAALPFLLGLSWVGCRWITTVALAPVRQLAHNATEIEADRLNRRLEVSTADDEVDQLAGVLNALFDRLDASFKQARRFSAEASHELKTPLTILRVSIEEMLEDPALDPRQQPKLADLLEQTTHLSGIIEALLLLARADSNQVLLDLKLHDVRDILELCIEDGRIMADPQGITIEAVLPDELHFAVDKARLVQITLNLLDNAIKYNVPGGRITVSVDEQGRGAVAGNQGEARSVVIRFGNTSKFCLEPHREQLFDRFYRHADVSEVPGSGLGLSIARELALIHGGDLRLVKSDGEWTEFALELPMRVGAAK